MRLAQAERGYRVAIDPVLLAAAIPAKEGDVVLDLGCGVGAAGLCLARRVGGCRVLGVDMDPRAVSLARENIEANDFADRMEIVEADLLRLPKTLKPGSFDHAMANPPHLAASSAQPSPRASRARAMVEGEATLADWIAAALRLLRTKGSLTMIHRADRLDELLAHLHGKAGGVVVFPLWPMRGRPAKRVIVQATKGSRSPAVLAPGLVLHRDGGLYSRAAESILRRGVGLAI